MPVSAMPCVRNRTIDFDEIARPEVLDGDPIE
jgi:hypothetical protein